MSERDASLILNKVVFKLSSYLKLHKVVFDQHVQY